MIQDITILARIVGEHYIRSNSILKDSSVDGEPVPVLYKCYSYIKDEGSIDCNFAKV
jgi:hypothetical protein